MKSPCRDYEDKYCLLIIKTATKAVKQSIIDVTTSWLLMLLIKSNCCSSNSLNKRTNTTSIDVLHWCNAVQWLQLQTDTKERNSDVLLWEHRQNDVKANNTQRERRCKSTTIDTTQHYSLLSDTIVNKNQRKRLIIDKVMSCLTAMVRRSRSKKSLLAAATDHAAFVHAVLQP